MLGALIMIIALPFVNDLLPVPFFVSLFGVLGFALVAGITNPRQRWVGMLDLLFSAGAFLTFEYFALDAYLRFHFERPLFLINQLLAIVFFVALYFASKTARGFFVDGVKK